MKYIKFIGYGLLTLSVIIIAAFLITGDFANKEFVLLDALMNWTYFILGAAVLLAIVLPLINVVKNPKALLKSMLGIGVVAVLILVCYLMADTTPIKTPATTYDDPTYLLISDTGLYATYFAFSAAIIAIVAGEIYSVFKR